MFKHLDRIRTFIAVVDCQSFTQAAEKLFISKAMASMHIKALEHELRVTLLVRTTRGVTLTEAGHILYRDFQSIFKDIQSSIEQIENTHNTLVGNLNITSTLEFGEVFLIPLIAQFGKQYPKLKINYYVDSSITDLRTEQLDLAIRLGKLEDSDLKCRKLGCYEVIIVASPDYLKQFPCLTVEQLKQMAWISNRNLKNFSQWTLTKNKKNYTFSITPQHYTNSAFAIKSMVCLGMGISILPKWLVQKELEQNTLVQVLPEYSLPLQDITIVYPNSSHIRSVSRKFIDYLAEQFQQGLSF